LGGNRLLADLHDDGLAALQRVLDLRRLLSATAPAAATALRLLALLAVLALTIAFFASRGFGGVCFRGRRLIVIGVIVVIVLVPFLVVGKVGVVEEGALFGADIDERGLQSWLDRFNLAEIDVSDHPLVLRTVDLQLN